MHEPSMGALPARSTKAPQVEPRLPTLFGRLTLLFDSHERHLTVLENLNAMCRAIEAGQAVPAELDPCRLLFELALELSAHFEIEESPAHFGVMARERPDLLPRVVDLKADHAGLLRALGRIDHIAADKARWPELPLLVSAVREELTAHEQAESDLIQEFFASHRDGTRPLP
jgi:hypothetical protein